MSSPRHLWSGDWERVSAEREEELAARARLQLEAPADEPAPAAAPEYVPLGTRLARLLKAAFAALAALLRGVVAGLRRVNPRAVLLASLIAAIVVAGAFGLSALFGGGTSNAGGPRSASLRAADALLGVQLSTPPNGGVVIATVTRGGPAELAGLDPGDLMTGIDNRPVDGSGDVASALSGLHAGDHVAIQVSRGSAIVTTLVTLTSP